MKKAPEDRNVVIAYVSAYGYTKQLAETIAEGLADGGVQHIQMFDLSPTTTPLPRLRCSPPTASCWAAPLWWATLCPPSTRCWWA